MKRHTARAGTTRDIARRLQHACSDDQALNDRRGDPASTAQQWRGRGIGENRHRELAPDEAPPPAIDFHEAGRAAEQSSSNHVLLASRFDPPSSLFVSRSRDARRESRRNAQGHARWGVHPARDDLDIGQLMLALGGGCRLDIVAMLALAPATTGAIAKRLQRSCSTISKELARLQEAGIAAFTQRGNRRIFRLTERVRVRQRHGMLQLGIATPAGHWLWIHLDESFGNEPAIPLPDRFIG